MIPNVAFTRCQVGIPDEIDLSGSKKGGKYTGKKKIAVKISMSGTGLEEWQKSKHIFVSAGHQIMI